MNKIRLQWKVFAFLLTFCALLLGILWLFQTVFLEDMYKHIRRQELNKAIADVEKEIAGLEIGDLAVISARIQAENDILVVPTGDFTAPPQHQVGQFGGGRINSYRVASGTITEVREFELANGQTISLTFHAVIAPVNATVSTLRLQLYLITIVMIMSAVMLAVIIAKRVSKPIEEVNRNAGELAKGNYDVRFDVKGFHEIVELSKTLNTAAVELGRVEALRRELLANISHDLRTPLALIYGYAEMMSDFPDEITVGQTKTIMDETQRLTTLVNDVLDLSRHEGDAETLNISRYNLTESISLVTARVRELLRNEGFQIDFVHDGEVFVNADESKISRAFYNLLINAVNHSGDCRTVTIRQDVHDDCVRISVTDRGEGISREDLPFVWDRYYKSGEAHKRAVMGTGLGLSIVKRIIESHNGKYGVDSVVGRGSTFWFEGCL